MSGRQYRPHEITGVPPADAVTTYYGRIRCRAADHSLEVCKGLCRLGRSAANASYQAGLIGVTKVLRRGCRLFAVIDMGARPGLARGWRARCAASTARHSPIWRVRSKAEARMMLMMTIPPTLHHT